MWNRAFADGKSAAWIMAFTVTESWISSPAKQETQA